MLPEKTTTVKPKKAPDSNSIDQSVGTPLPLLPKTWFVIVIVPSLQPPELVGWVELVVKWCGLVPGPL